MKINSNETIAFEQHTILVPALLYITNRTDEVFIAEAGKEYPASWLFNNAFLTPHHSLYAIGVHGFGESLDNSDYVEIVDMYSDSVAYWNSTAEFMEISE